MTLAFVDSITMGQVLSFVLNPRLNPGQVSCYFGVNTWSVGSRAAVAVGCDTIQRPPAVSFLKNEILVFVFGKYERRGRSSISQNGVAERCLKEAYLEFCQKHL